MNDDLDELETAARDLAEIIRALVPTDFRFVLVLAGRGSLTYVSDGERVAVAEMLAELATIVRHNAAAPPGTPGHLAHTKRVPS